MDIEQTMRFILDTQAKLEASAQAHNERIAANERQIQANATHIAANTAHIAQLVDVSLSLARVAEETNASLKEVTESVKELREAQAASDYKLNALIDTVDKLVRRNGETPKP